MARERRTPDPVFSNPLGRRYSLAHAIQRGSEYVLAAPSRGGEPIVLQEGTRSEVVESFEGDHLFLEFRDLPLTEESMLAVAIEHGLLTEGLAVVDEQRIVRGAGASVSLWLEEVEELQIVCHLYEAIGRRDLTELESLLPPKNVAEHAEMLAGAGIDVDWLDELIGGAASRIALLVSNALEDFCRPRLTLRPPPHRNGESSLLVEGSVDTGPASLIGALWLDAALVFASGVAITRCEWCDRSFVARPRGVNSKRFCSTTCRVNGHLAELRSQQS